MLCLEHLISSALRFDKGFNNLRERTIRFRHFYLARRAQRILGTFNQHLPMILSDAKWPQMLSSFGYWELLQPFNDLKVHQNITIQIP